MDEAYLPQWGQFPVEQYLIRYWDHSSSETPDNQRLRLIHQFLDLDEFPSEWDPGRHSKAGGGMYGPPPRIPTANEVETILRPWRSENLRKIAWKIWGSDNNQLISLRTHYDYNDDHKIAELVGTDELDEYDVAWWALLNDPELFNFGDQWWLIFDILTELAGPTQGYSRLPFQEFITRDRQHLMDKLPKLKRTDEWRTNRDKYLEIETARCRRTISARFFAIADREAFETDKLRLIYLDGKRNLVQECRVDFDEYTFVDVVVDWQNLVLPYQLWERGMAGEKYRINGELGRELYQLDEADLD